MKRNEEVMMNLILETAKSDKRIRGVIMQGSRVNKRITPDEWQDYDIIYVVNETLSFIEDKNWIHHFGEILYMQLPENEHLEECYGWLVQFKDGNRLDLHVDVLNYAKKVMAKDSLSLVLLDKDHVLGEPIPNDSSYWVKPMDEGAFHQSCNEFWWCLNNVGKGLARQQIPLVMDMSDILRKEYLKLLEQEVAFAYDYQINVGKSGKFLPCYLEDEVWQNYLSTYSDAKLENLWKAVSIMCRGFDTQARKLAKLLGFQYNETEAKASFEYFNEIKRKSVA